MRLNLIDLLESACVSFVYAWIYLAEIVFAGKDVTVYSIAMEGGV